MIVSVGRVARQVRRQHPFLHTLTQVIPHDAAPDWVVPAGCPACQGRRQYSLLHGCGLEGALTGRQQAVGEGARDGRTDQVTAMRSPCMMRNQL